MRQASEEGPQQLVAAARALGVRDERVLRAVADTPREDFVPTELRHTAYRDAPVPLPRDQTTSQPSLVAQMVEALGLDPGDTVLEIGTGYGYQTALLARLAARVVSVERHADLADAARANLDRAGITNAEVRVGDGTEGAPDAAPFAGIVVSAAFHAVPPPLVDQLAEGGRLVMPIGGSGYDEVIRYVRRGAVLAEQRMLTGARFVPLTGRHAFPE